jgi:hypothetical protein
MDVHRILPSRTARSFLMLPHLEWAGQITLLGSQSALFVSDRCAFRAWRGRLPFKGFHDANMGTWIR